MNQPMQQETDAAVEVLRRGGIIVYPTDTVWGIGCDATNAAAVERVYALKRSQNKKGMIILVDKLDNVVRYFNRTPAVAWELFELADKPLTLVLPNAVGVAPNLIPEEGTLAVRVPNHEFCGALLRKLGRPLVSTSANISGEDAPTGFGDISAEVLSGADFVVNRKFEGRPTGKPSAIVALGERGEVTIIRS